MRLNKYLALCSDLSRRAADEAIKSGRVTANSTPGQIGQEVGKNDTVKLDGNILKLPSYKIIILNKPTGYVVSRLGQGSKTVYDILPDSLKGLNAVGRLDKDSSGLLVLTNNGDLAQKLSHPSYQKNKIYEVTLNKPLSGTHQQQIQKGVMLYDGLSHLGINGSDMNWTISMKEGKNRQIRRTFEELGYNVEKLHRTNFGPYMLNDLKSGDYIEIPTDAIL